MGDRGNIAIIQSQDRTEQVWLYSHWGGTELPERLQTGLRDGKGRWGDDTYLTRIIICRAIPVNQIMEETGYGISTRISDNEHDILVVDCPSRKVFTMSEAKLKDGRVPAGFVPDPKQTWTFEEYIALENPPTI